MAISCLVQKDQPLWNLDLDFEERVNHLAAHQLSDMTFGNAHTTALAIQALQAAQRVVTQIWPPVHVGRTQFDRVHGATSALCAMAENDGSYGHSVFTTAEVLPALRWRTYIRDDALCRVTSPEPINTNGMYNVWQTNPKYITVDMLVKNAIDVNTYYNERLESVTANSSLHKILTEVQEMDPNFSFETEQTELGNMLTSLFNVDASLRDNSFWAVYRSAPGGDEYAVHVGIDEFIPQDGDTIVLKYRRADGDAQF
ncbi:PREDICTED: gastric intrinsic factor-like [Priapulus caudatus]|uniref:Gastric intrinsic factor-like n=1 Tax=Priapulus caudatus TaxID=37621 RepID=A0ABM1E6T7_PRICU|nr:PREDICTED: gastric intrinsic factor-like [Priapulus caudatus]